MIFVLVVFVFRDKALGARLVLKSLVVFVVFSVCALLFLFLFSLRGWFMLLLSEFCNNGL